MNGHELLSENIQKKIWQMGWEQLTPIQEQGIQVIMATEHDVILSSATASGKTEAAFLPILSLVEQSAKENLAVLYISPLKALINNQFERIEYLCENLYIPVQRWHGDISYATKKKFFQDPKGILQITPESIESLFVNHSDKLTAIFQNVQYVVIDEIHSFIDNERGVHLRSLLYRLQQYANKVPRIIGLSATIDNFNLVKKWVNPTQPTNVEIIEVKHSDKRLNYHLMYVEPAKKREIPIALIKDIYEITKYNKALIFANSRGLVENLTFQLNEICQQNGLEQMYFPHHSSIDKEEREYVEKYVANSHLPLSIVATSSLELGIDIGAIDIVIQLNSTARVSSLKQRLGRSGRKQDAAQFLQLYATNPDDLLQSVALLELIKEKWVEPAQGYQYPLEVLFQQIISICKEKNGIDPNELLKIINEISLFQSIPLEDRIYLINYMLDTDMLEMLNGTGQLIIGYKGEGLLKSLDFYGVFKTFDMFKVINGSKVIGEISVENFVGIGSQILLAGRQWKVVDMNVDELQLFVEPGELAKVPLFSGDGIDIHGHVVEKMLEVICTEDEYQFVNKDAFTILTQLRNKYRANNIQMNERIIWDKGSEYDVDLFTSSKVARTLQLILENYTGLKIQVFETDIISLSKKFDILSFLQKIIDTNWTDDMLIEMINDKHVIAPKFAEYLPLKLRKKMHLAQLFDMEGLLNLIKNHTFRVIKLDITIERD